MIDLFRTHSVHSFLFKEWSSLVHCSIAAVVGFSPSPSLTPSSILTLEKKKNCWSKVVSIPMCECSRADCPCVPCMAEVFLFLLFKRMQTLVVWRLLPEAERRLGVSSYVPSGASPIRMYASVRAITRFTATLLSSFTHSTPSNPPFRALSARPRSHLHP